MLREGWAMKRSQELSWAQMLMAPNAAMLTGAALVQGPPGVGGSAGGSGGQANRRQSLGG